mgnify:CR=1 FL=1
MRLSSAATVGLALGLCAPAFAADPQTIDWPNIPTQSITLFYPGLSTYNWLVSPGHPGAKLVEQGQACLPCHKGSEKERGDKFVKGCKIAFVSRGVLSLKFSDIIDGLRCRRFISRPDNGLPRDAADADEQPDDRDHDHQFDKIKTALIP